MFLSFNTIQTTESLVLDLRTFGLNPSDWTILRDKKQVYKIKSKTDGSFIFRGQVKKKGPKLKWEKLELISI